MGRYNGYKTRPLPRIKRTIALYGENDDAGKWYRCWNCKFQVDSTKVTLNDRSNIPQKIHQEIHRSNNPSGQSNESWVRGLSAMLKLGGLPIMGLGVKHTYYPDVGSGCPFCGTTNYR